jgi:hypothetical protein
MGSRDISHHVILLHFPPTLVSVAGHVPFGPKIHLMSDYGVNRALGEKKGCIKCILTDLIQFAI